MVSVSVQAVVSSKYIPCFWVAVRGLGGFVDVGEEGCFGEFEEEGCLLAGDGGEVFEELVEIDVVEEGLDGDAGAAEAGFATNAILVDPDDAVDGGVEVGRHSDIRAGWNCWGYCPERPMLGSTRDGGESVDGGEVCLFEFGEVVENFRFRHTGGEPAEHIPNGDSQAADAGLAGTLPCFDCDPGIHVRRIAGMGSLKTRTAPEDRCRRMSQNERHRRTGAVRGSILDRCDAFCGYACERGLL